jgi:hypothetical protein
MDEEMSKCQWLELTNEEEWQPYSEKFHENKLTAVHKSGRRAASTPVSSNYDIDDIELRSISCVFSQDLTLQHDIFNEPIERKPTYIRSNAGMSIGTKLSVSAQELAERWGITHSMAQNTLKVMTQKFIRSAINPIERRYRTAIQPSRYKQLGTQSGRFYSDTMFASKKSIHQHACGQIFVNNVGFYYFVPMTRKGNASDALMEFIQHVGIPSFLHTDGAKAQTLGEWK